MIHKTDSQSPLNNWQARNNNTIRQQFTNDETEIIQTYQYGRRAELNIQTLPWLPIPHQGARSPADAPSCNI